MDVRQRFWISLAVCLLALVPVFKAFNAVGATVSGAIEHRDRDYLV